MGWLFGSNSPQDKTSGGVSELDQMVPPPPGGSPFAPPPEAPKSRSGSSPTAATDKPFSGFSPPPLTTSSNLSSSSSASKSSNATTFDFSKLLGTSSQSSSSTSPTDDPYSSQNFSKYTSQINESDGLRDHLYAEQMRDRQAKGDGMTSSMMSTRFRRCLEGMKQSAITGGAVGGLFGTGTGLYFAVTQRQLILLPTSIVGCAASFGFFLCCGSILRC